MSDDALPEATEELGRPDTGGRLRWAVERLVVLGVLCVCVGGMAVAVFKVGLVENRQVVGNNKVSSDQILESAQIDQGAPIPFIDRDEVRKRVLEAHPWVSDVSVSAKWPSTVELKVSERSPQALIATTDKRYARVSADGYVLEASEQGDRTLPLIMDETVEAGVGSRASDRAQQMLALVSHLPDSLRPKVVQVQLRDDRDGYLGLSTGPIVELGPIDHELGAKLTSAAAILSRDDNAKIKVLDVRSSRMPLAQPK